MIIEQKDNHREHAIEIEEGMNRNRFADKPKALQLVEKQIEIRIDNHKAPQQDKQKNCKPKDHGNSQQMRKVSI